MVRFAALSLLVFAVATGSALSAVGWRTHRGVGGSFSIGAPTSWLDFTRRTPEVLRQLRVDPRLRPYLDLVRQNKAIKLVLVDVTGPTMAHGFATNLNVLRLPAVGSLEFMAKGEVAQLKRLNVAVGAVRMSYVRLPAGRAVKLFYRARYSQTSPVVSATQFLFVRAGHETVLTYSTLPAAEKAYRATFNRSSRSFRFR